MQKLDWFDPLGDWNPQLLRELKGRLKLRNLILAGAVSVLGQFFLVMSFLVRLPYLTLDSKSSEVLPTSHPYCTSPEGYGNYRKCLVDPMGNLLVDWQRWSLDLFLVLSLISIFGLLIAGTYLLIDNLAQEERRGTLNFIRLSPRSPQSILWGKILGVPILLYIVALLAIPLHLWAGFAAYIPLIRILSFYGVLGISCLFFYSLSLLFGLVSSSELNGFQAWLGSGVVFLFLLTSISKPLLGNAFDWLNVFSPVLVLQYLIAASGIKPTIVLSPQIQALQWFSVPVGMGIIGTISLLVLNYSLWTYWSWQAMQRRFPNPSKTIFSKRQSYLLVACFEIVVLGFAVVSDRSSLMTNFEVLLAYNFVWFFGLIITLTPQKQALIDWARYRKQKSLNRKGLLNSSLLRDLVWGEKSPAIVAIALNLAITTIVLILWIVAAPNENDKLSALMALVFSIISIMVYAAIAQLVVFIKGQQQGLWLIGTLSAVIIAPPLMLALLSVDMFTAPTLWLLTAFAFGAVKNAEAFSIFLALLGQLSLLTLCSWQMTRQLKKAGESNSLALLASQPKIKPY